MQVSYKNLLERTELKAKAGDKNMAQNMIAGIVSW